MNLIKKFWLWILARFSQKVHNEDNQSKTFEPFYEPQKHIGSHSKNNRKHTRGRRHQILVDYRHYGCILASKKIIHN